MALIRLHDFVSGTIIQDSQVDAEFNQLVEALNGIGSVDILHKFSHAANPVLNLNQLGAGLIERWQNAGVDRATLSALGKLLLPAGIGATPSSISTDAISNLGTYFSDGTSRPTPASTTETDLSTRTMAANVMATDNDFIFGFANVTYAANANTKRYRIYVGATAFFDTGAVAFNNVEHFIIFLLIRRTSAILRGIFASLTTNAGTGSGASFVENGAFNFAASNIIKSTGQNGSASASDIVQRAFVLVKGSV